MKYETFIENLFERLDTTQQEIKLAHQVEANTAIAKALIEQLGLCFRTWYCN